MIGKRTATVGPKYLERPTQGLQSGLCKICLSSTERTCTSCRMIFFCSPQHENTDQTHKKLCIVPPIAYSGGKNPKGSDFRVIATKDISAGQIILREYPLVVGAKDNFESANKIISCIGCCQSLGKRRKALAGNEMFQCPKCGWPVCSIKCAISTQHAFIECPYFCDQNISYPAKIDSFRLSYFMYKGIYVLRALIIKQRNPELVQELMRLPAMIGGQSNKCASTHDKLIYKLLVDTFRISSLFVGGELISEEGLSKFIDHLCVYGFSASVYSGQSQNFVDGFYWNASKISRSCTPNVAWSIGPGPDFMMQLVSACDIKVNEELKLPYATELYKYSTFKRQEHIRSVFGRICRCFRCKDPSEMGTYFSAVKCNECVEGYLVSADLLNIKSFLQCTNDICPNCKQAGKICGEVERLRQRAEQVIQNPGVKGTEELEELIQNLRAENFLHPNHFVLYKLVWEMVTRQVGDLQILDWSALDSFLSHCQYLLEIEEKLGPTLSQEKATLCFFMGRAFFRQYEIFLTTGASRKDALIALDKIMDLYDEARKYFITCGGERSAITTIHMDMKTIVSVINNMKK